MINYSHIMVRFGELSTKGKNKKDFIRRAGTRFTKDSFIEEVDFDYLDFHVIEEDFI